MHTAPFSPASQGLNAKYLIAIVAAGQKENERGDGWIEMEGLKKQKKKVREGKRNRIDEQTEEQKNKSEAKRYGKGDEVDDEVGEKDRYAKDRVIQPKTL